MAIISFFEQFFFLGAQVVALVLLVFAKRLPGRGFFVASTVAGLAAQVASFASARAFASQDSAHPVNVQLVFLPMALLSALGSVLFLIGIAHSVPGFLGPKDADRGLAVD